MEPTQFLRHVLYRSQKRKPTDGQSTKTRLRSRSAEYCDPTPDDAFDIFASERTSAASHVGNPTEFYAEVQHQWDQLPPAQKARYKNMAERGVVTDILGNTADTDGLVFIETQTGDCREDDIVRLQDDYGRIDTKQYS